MNARMQVVSTWAIGLMVLCRFNASGQTNDPAAKLAKSDTSAVTPEYLSAHGFVESEGGPGMYSLLNVRIGDAARDLGFALSDLRPTPSQPVGSDVRTVKIRNLCFVVHARTKGTSGRRVAESLNDPNSICTINVVLNHVPPERELQKKANQPNEVSPGTALPLRP